MRIARRRFTAGLASAVFGLPSLASDGPASPIRIIVPFPPGGSVDAIARLLAPGLQTRLGATVIIDNIGGASGSIGAAIAARAAPDGRTWLLAFDSHAVNPALMPDLPFDTQRDLTPVYLIGTAPNLLAAHPAKPFSRFRDVLAAAVAAPDRVTYASIGTGSVGHLTMVRLTGRTGTKLVHVPYRGGGPAVTDAVAGHVDLIVGSAALLIPQIKAGALRAVLQTGKERLPALPDIDTVADAGLPGLESYAWWGMFSPRGTPAHVIEGFVGALRATLSDAQVQSRLVTGQQMTPRNEGPDLFKRFFEEQVETWRKVVKEHGLKGNS